jgi:hypothetical protein
MARVNPDGVSRKNSVRLPSAQEMSIRRNYEARLDPTAVPKRIASGRGGYAMTVDDAVAAASLMDRTRVVSPFAGLPVAAQTAEFKTAQGAFGDSDTTGGTWDEYFDYDQSGYNYANLATTVIDPDTGQPTGGPVVSGSGREPAPITLIPTSSINPERPRTVAAGYDGSRKVLTVVFRDGTFYNYYDVSEGEWASFKVNHSKGRYIFAVLDAKPRGTASMASASMAAREGLYRIARTGQWVYDGQLTGQTDRSAARINPTKSKKPRKARK